MKNLSFMGFPLYAVTREGKVYSEISKKFLKNSLSSTSKAVRVNLRNDEGIKTVEVHRLVGLCFLPNPENHPVLNHKDGNRSNPHVDNLEWCTQEHNANHAVNTGLFECRSLNLELAHHIFGLMEEGYRNIDIAEITGISYAIIAKMRQGENYRDIWEEYDIPCKKYTISLAKAEKILRMLEAGDITDKIIKEMKVSRSLVKDIRDGYRFSSLKKSLYKSATTIERED